MKKGLKVGFYAHRLHDSEHKVFCSLHTSAWHYPYDNCNKRKIIKNRKVGIYTK